MPIKFNATERNKENGSSIAQSGMITMQVFMYRKAKNKVQKHIFGIILLHSFKYKHSQQSLIVPCP